MTDALLSAAVNVVLLGALPLGAYGAVQRWQHGRGVREVLERAGLRTGETRYLAYAAIGAAVSVAALLLWCRPRPRRCRGRAPRSAPCAGWVSGPGPPLWRCCTARSGRAFPRSCCSGAW